MPNAQPASSTGLPQELQEQFLREFPTLSAWMTQIYDNAFMLGKYGDAWKRPYLEPKKFLLPNGYHSPKIVSASLYMILGESQLKHDAGEFTVPIQITAQSIAYAVVNSGVPTYFVEEDFIRAVAATDLPTDTIIDELMWPMPGMVIAFPVRFMQEYAGTDTCYVFAARSEVGERHCNFLPDAPGITTERAKVAWVWFGHSRRGTESFASAYFTNDTLGATVTDYTYTDYTNSPQPVIDFNKTATDKVSILMLKLLCALNWRDGLVKDAQCVKAAKSSKGKDYAALWSPNIIGQGYRLARERSTPAGGHASPRPHLRSGHFAYVAVGKKEDFISVTQLARTSLGAIDWPNVDDATKEKFQRSHRRKWIMPTLVLS